MTKILNFTAALFLASAVLVTHGQELNPEPVTLEGILQQGEYFGPPGWGARKTGTDHD
jgi:hypothetical protein